MLEDDYDLDMEQDDYDIPSALIDLELSEISFLILLLYCCVDDCEHVLSDDASSDVNKHNAKLMHKEASVLLKYLHDMLEIESDRVRLRNNENNWWVRYVPIIQKEQEEN